MIIQKFAQSTFLLENHSGKRLLIDPGSYNFERGFEPKDFGPVDVLIITHKHADHFDLTATKTLVDLHRPTVLTNPEISVVLKNESIDSLSAEVGDTFDLQGFRIVCIKTDHVVRDELIVNFGLVIYVDEKRVYHTSDTRLIELGLLPEGEVASPDLLCLPIGNRGVVMGIDDALYFANEIQPRYIIPMHYDSPKDRDRIRPEHFVARLAALSEALPNLSENSVKILQFGQQIEIG